MVDETNNAGPDAMEGLEFLPGAGTVRSGELRGGQLPGPQLGLDVAGLPPGHGRVLAVVCRSATRPTLTAQRPHLEL